MGTTQQDEAISTTTRAQEAEALNDRQIATLREEQLQKDREIEAFRRQLNSSEATAREAHSRFQVQMEVQRQLMLPPSTTLDKIAVLMTGIIVDTVDPIPDILVSAANLRTDIVGRGADLVTIIIVSMITPTTGIATSLDP